MIFFELKQHFTKQLSLIYSLQECEQIFFLLLEDMFSISRIDYSLEKQSLVEEGQEQKIKLVLQELKTNKPIQHILGYGYFFERRFKVSKDVLIPRQETEELVDLMLKSHQNKSLQVLDIGTGTGCIPISLKLENLLLNISSIDVSAEALSIAKKNAKDLNADVNFSQLDILNAKEWDLFKDNSLDVIVSNPPYVRYQEKLEMHKNVVNFDPELALYVDDKKPLIFYEKITRFASVKLKKRGVLYFEINEVFGKEVQEVLKKHRFILIKIIKDMQGKDRFVKGVKSEK